MYALIMSHFKALLHNHQVKKGKPCLHDGSDDGPEPGTLSSPQQVLVLHPISINNIMPCIIIVVKRKPHLHDGKVT